MGNLGHSIVRQKNDRIYIEKGNQICLGEVHYFTFEPHISVQGSKYGYKRENIYYFENGEIKELCEIDKINELASEKIYGIVFVEEG